MEASTVWLPAYLASRLVNGDGSGLSEAEERDAVLCEAYVAPGRIVSTRGETVFGKLYTPVGFNGDLLEYVVLTEVKST